MTNPRDPIGEWDLLAYADDRLDGRRRAEVEAHLTADPAAAERVRAFRDQSTAIHSLYDPVLDEPVPDRLRKTLEGRRPVVTPILVRMAAALALTFGAGYGGWWLRGHEESPRPAVEAFLAQMAVSTESASVRPVSERGEPSGSAVPLPAEAPDLSRHGYQLVGRSHGLGADGGTLRLDYRGPAGPLSLFLGSLPPEATAPTKFTYPGGRGLYWTEGPYVYALTGTDRTLPAVAETIRRQTARPPGGSAPLAANAETPDRAGMAAPISEPPAGPLKILPLGEPLEPL